MHAVGRTLLALIAGGVVLGGVVTAFFFYRPQAAYDSSFDTSVSAPAYTGAHPIVVFDEGHRNAHVSSTGYRPFAELLRNDGYDLRVHATRFTVGTLGDAAILAINAPRGANDANDGPAFDDAEQAIIVEWVRAGGSLLLVTDHWPFGVSVAGLGRRFGVDVSGGMTADPEHYEASLGDTHVVYSRANGLLGEHPITNGRNAGERIENVIVFTGQSLSVPVDASAFLRLGDTAIDYPPSEPSIAREGGDVRVSMTYGDAISARGRAQGIAFEFGAGRVVMLGETAMLRAQRDGRDRVGMNYPGYDNRQLALNIMHWLSRLV